MTQTQEAVYQSREDVRAIRDKMCEELAGSRESVQRELERHRETMEQYRQRINSIFNMLSLLPKFWLPLKFPP